jgi:gas vesicle protein
MMENQVQKTSAELQREIDRDRRRIGDRIDAIQERVSPGQLVDEVLSYAKGSGGGEYVSNLGQALKANPLPVALIGVSLAWLMAKSGSTPSSNLATSEGTDALPDHPLFVTEGTVRRLGPPETSEGGLYSHFVDSTGKKFKALTDETGNRAGHFIDETGKSYRGFSDAAGNYVDHIADETGEIFDTASGWVSEKWQQTKSAASGVGEQTSRVASHLSDRSSSVKAGLAKGGSNLNDAILSHFRDQPLVGGAIAFAAGAAIGAALPNTDMEDELLGTPADSTKDAISEHASTMVGQGKEIASELYERAAQVASEAHDMIKERVVEEVDDFKAGADKGLQS